MACSQWAYWWLSLNALSLTVGVETVLDPRASYGWSKYRYSRYDQTPQPQDKESAILAGGDVKCDVCEVIVADIMGGLAQKRRLGTRSDQELVAEALEAEAIDEKDVEAAADDMERYVEKHRKGCNKLFKDNYLRLGWNIRACRRMPDNGLEPVPWACATRAEKMLNATEMNTYTVQMESIHYACESTIGKYIDELSEFLAHGFQKSGQSKLKDLASEACRKAAKCTERKASETADARTKLAENRLIDQDVHVDDVIRQAKKELKENPLPKKGRRRKKKRDTRNTDL